MKRYTWHGRPCRAVYRADGREVKAGTAEDTRPGKMGRKWSAHSRLVEFDDTGERSNVLWRTLRTVK